MRRVNERNEIVAELVTELDCEWDKLFTISEEIPVDCRNEDGVHYTASGYDLLADSVAKSILRLLRK